MRPKDFDINKVIEYLEYGSIAFQEALDNLYPDMLESDLTAEDKAEFDDRLFYCDSCGTWYDISERNSTDGNGDVCGECKAQEEDTDDEEE